MTNNYTINDFIEGRIRLNLQDGVKVEIHCDRNPRMYLIALYDNREWRPISASWLCDEREALRRIPAINILYGVQ